MGLSGSSISMALAQWVAEAPARTVVVCPVEDDIRRISEDLRFFFKLLGVSSEPRVLLYPPRPSDLNPAQLAEPHLNWERLSTLHHTLQSSDPAVIVTTLHALGQWTIPKAKLQSATDLLVPGAEAPRDDLVRKLLEAGYENDSVVSEPGAMAVRGGIVDLFPPHLAHPFRIEFVGDEVESIRAFDPESQRSLGALEEATWTPCREILLDPNARDGAIRTLKELADSLDLPRSARATLEDAILEGRYSPQMDSLLPVFYEKCDSLLDYLPPETFWVSVDPFSLKREEAELRSTYERIGTEITQRNQLAFSPDRLSLPLDDLFRRVSENTRLTLSDIQLETGESEGNVETFRIQPLSEFRRLLTDRKKSDSPLKPFLDEYRTWRASGLGVIFVASTEPEAQRLQHLLSHEIRDIRIVGEASPEAISSSIERPIIILGSLSSGFRFDDEHFVLISEREFFGERKHTIRKEIAREDVFSSLSELNPGDLVVHLDHGVGRYHSLERLTIGRVANDFLHLEYAGGDKLYLPVYRLNRIQRYVGAEGAKPHLDRLGNQSAWEKTKAKAEKAVEEMAQELIELYAARKIAKGHSFSGPDETYLGFESEFPYEETRDQLRAIDEVSDDLEGEKPMDRLICGDVGFGKTEVALRAAFRVAMEGKQVGLLVPTTILAQQHFDTFSARLKNYPVRIDFLSRFKTPQEQKKVVEDLKTGNLDIVVGTHRLLSNDVQFKDLGLLVIDEEHRFGVNHKEKIKKFRNKVDVLTLTATPIPRTLQMSMAGIRDLSVINTPPLDRKSIHTTLAKFDDSLIRGAILKELDRGGQVFFVHNRVESIYAMGAYLKKLIPKARIEVGHGQMSEHQLEETMHRFQKQEFDVLLCTTIIESGLDIPNANTILINRADALGLAQLYQLRGRVGRSDRSAYAYLLVPGEDLITRDALKRLKVVKRFTDLGSGLKIALHDLEIRGAGNLLGSSQSGQIAAVGFELYTQLLEREVRRLKGEALREEIDPEIHSVLPAYFPDDYVPSTGERLVLYKRLSGVQSSEERLQIETELVDRFGPLPPTAKNLLQIIDLKLLAKKCGVLALRLTGEKPSVEFSDNAPIHVDRLLKLVQKDRRLSFRPDQKLTIELRQDQDAIDEVTSLLAALMK